MRQHRRRLVGAGRRAAEEVGGDLTGGGVGEAGALPLAAYDEGVERLDEQEVGGAAPSAWDMTGVAPTRRATRSALST